MSTYTPEDLFTIALVALRNPDGNHNSNGFWNRMTRKYGSEFFRGREGNCLCYKWRKIEFQIGHNLHEYYQGLEQALEGEVVKRIKREMDECEQNEEAENEPKEFVELAGKKCALQIMRRRPLASELDNGNESCPEPSHKLKLLEGSFPSSVNLQTVPARRLFNLARFINLPALQHAGSRGTPLQRLATSWDNHGFPVHALPDDLEQRRSDSPYLMVTLQDGEITWKDLRTLEGFPGDKENFSLSRAMEDFGRKYKVPHDRLHNLFGQLSGNLTELERFLQGQDVNLWSNLEDLVLLHPENPKMFQYLVRLKGAMQITKRQEFLNFFRSTSVS